MKNKLQSRKFSCAVIEDFDREFITLLFNAEKTFEEVSLISQDMYPSNSGLSIRSLKCYCAKHGVSRRIPQNTLENMVAEIVEGIRFRSRHKEVS